MKRFTVAAVALAALAFTSVASAEALADRDTCLALKLAALHDLVQCPDGQLGCNAFGDQRAYFAIVNQALLLGCSTDAPVFNFRWDGWVLDPQSHQWKFTGKHP
jgi:hypothetical protein